MNQDSVSVKEIVEYGLDTIEADRTISVNLRDLIYVHKVLQEYMRFFHQPSHYQKLSDVIAFLGNKNSGGAFEVLHTALYKKSDNILSSDIQELLDKEDMIHPKYPNYYQ